MIDGLGVYFPEARIPDACLDRLKDLLPIRGEGCFTGKLDNMRVTQGHDAVFVRGSLPKYLAGANALPLTRAALRDGLGKLEAALGLPLAAGRVHELEVATTLPVEAPPRDYLAAWAVLPRFARSTFGNGGTVTFATRARAFTGYDKGAESSPDVLPVPLDGLHGLRLELRYKAGLKRFLGRSVAPWSLAEADTYREIIHGWAAVYFKVLKRREVVLQINGMTQKGMERTFACLGLAVYGLDRAEAIIAEGRASGALDKLTASRMRAWLRDLGQNARLTDTAPLTDEVDAKVREVERFAR